MARNGSAVNPIQRLAVLALTREGFSGRMIAEGLGLSPTTVGRIRRDPEAKGKRTRLRVFEAGPEETADG